MSSLRAVDIHDGTLSFAFNLHIIRTIRESVKSGCSVIGPRADCADLLIGLIREIR